MMFKMVMYDVSGYVINSLVFYHVPQRVPFSGYVWNTRKSYGLLVKRCHGRLKGVYKV